mmetsp:Transcript_6655/g.12566  ORF Transcript_6655/g.12566 Transcript_6655/m.12566 type:complete len:378 (+) Transcript_6655:239-1372(+)
MQDLKFRQYLNDKFQLENLPLSATIKQEMKVGTISPLLQQLPLFGITEKDQAEMKHMEKVFNRIDVDNSSHLDKNELETFLTQIDISDIEGALETLLSECDEVDFTMFYSWYYTFKYGRPVLKWPTRLVQAFASVLLTDIYSAGDYLLHVGQYGDEVFILKDFGSVVYLNEVDRTSRNRTGINQIARARTRRKSAVSSFNSTATTVSFTDDIPVVGMTAFLSQEAEQVCEEYLQFRAQVSVKAVEVTFTMHMKKSTVKQLMDQYWSDSEGHVKQLVGLHYSLEPLLDPQYKPQDQGGKLYRQTTHIAPSELNHLDTVHNSSRLLDLTATGLSVGTPKDDVNARIARLESNNAQVLDCMNRVLEKVNTIESRLAKQDL